MALLQRGMGWAAKRGKKTYASCMVLGTGTCDVSASKAGSSSVVMQMRVQQQHYAEML